MKRGGKSTKKNWKDQLKGFKNPVKDFYDLLAARIISPRINVDVSAATQMGKDILQKVHALKDLSDIYQTCNMIGSVRFSEQFNFPINIEQIKVAEDTSLNTGDIKLKSKKVIEIPYGLTVIMGGPDAGKSSLMNHIGAELVVEPTVAMEPIQDPEQPFLIGPAASALGILAGLYVEDNIILFDSGRFLRGISDYGLGEKGLPIGLSIFLTDVNNLYVYAKKRCFLVVSTESNKEDYNSAYYHLMRGAVNGVISPNTGEQSGFMEFKPANRTPVHYTYGDNSSFDAVPNLFAMRQQQTLEELDKNLIEE